MITGCPFPDECFEDKPKAEKARLTKLFEAGRAASGEFHFRIKAKEF